MVNYGWEYVWHCHILSHEEMDMMHSLLFGVAPVAPSGLLGNLTGSNASRKVVLTWNDNSLSETGFTVQRATDAAFVGGLTTFTVPANTKTLSDTIGVTTTPTFYYRVFANNRFGDTMDYGAGTVGFQNETVNSANSNVVAVVTNLIPQTPLTFTASVVSQAIGPAVRLDRSTANLAAYYAITRTGGTPVTRAVVQAPTTFLTDTRSMQAVTTLTYTLVATNTSGASVPPISVVANVPLFAAVGFTYTSATSTSIRLQWNSSGTNATYQLNRSSNPGMSNPVTIPIAAVASGPVTFRNTGLVTKTTYYYQVIVSAPGASSVTSNIIAVTTP